METTRRRVLCVDDHPDTCEIVRLLLTRHGYEVETAGTAADALKHASEEHFGAYILDNWLPDMDGVELLRRLRTLDPHIPIIFYSAAALESDRLQALEAGARAYVTKPAEPGELLGAVSRAIEEAKRAGPSSTPGRNHTK